MTAEGVLETNNVCKRHLQSEGVWPGVMRGVGPGDDGGVGEESQVI